MSGVRIELTGLGDVAATFKDLADEIGDKSATSKVLVPAVRAAMQPVLKAAQMFAPRDTGALALSLIVEARRPTKKDKRSTYVNNSDVAIAAVTTASGKKLAAMSEGKGLLKSQKRLTKMGFDSSKFKGMSSDARAISQEFGSASNPQHSYLRPAIESQAQQVVNNLASILEKRIAKYRKL
jgi:HK97 gp10 family phage protein